MAPNYNLSNIQTELLKLYTANISEKQLKDIKLILGNYFANQATIAMDKVWKKRNLTSDDMTKWTYEHNRIKSSN